MKMSYNKKNVRTKFSCDANEKKSNPMPLEQKRRQQSMLQLEMTLKRPMDSMKYGACHHRHSGMTKSDLKPKAPRRQLIRLIFALISHSFFSSSIIHDTGRYKSTQRVAPLSINHYSFTKGSRQDDVDKNHSRKEGQVSR